ncbi:hypothetical protein LTR53_016499, partial [Teratosphaeriaceae sp. CCFEE 6253]
MELSTVNPSRDLRPDPQQELRDDPGADRTDDERAPQHSRSHRRALIRVIVPGLPQIATGIVAVRGRRPAPPRGDRPASGGPALPGLRLRRHGPARGRLHAEEPTRLQSIEDDDAATARRPRASRGPLRLGGGAAGRGSGGAEAGVECEGEAGAGLAAARPGASARAVGGDYPGLRAVEVGFEQQMLPKVPQHDPSLACQADAVAVAPRSKMVGTWGSPSQVSMVRRAKGKPSLPPA